MQDPVLIAVLLAAVLPVASFAAGGLFVAWLLHTDRTGRTPLLRLPTRRRREEAKPQQPEPRRSNP